MGIQFLIEYKKNCREKRNCSFRAIFCFPTMFSKAVCYRCVKMSIYGAKFNAVFNSISAISRLPVHLSMPFSNSFDQCSAQYSYQATVCFPT